MGRRFLRIVILAGLTALWCLIAEDSLAAVQIVPDATLVVDGKTITGPAAIARHPVVKEIVAAFDRAETAVQKQDVDRLMTFYAQAFNYHGLKQPDVRRIWGEVFEHYQALSSTHLFSEIKVVRVGTHLRVEVTCTGGLYGTERATGRPITLDSWFREVHFLVNDEGPWRFLGNAGHAPSTAPFSSAPHHPLF